MSNCVYWLIGRGASIACNLSWGVPNSWKKLDRQEKIARIKKVITEEMDKPTINVSPYTVFLEKLSKNTVNPWQHLFLTTNWDYLLQREILNLNLEIKPNWLANSQVFHINGTVEVLENDSNRSPFLLEEDPGKERISTVEADTAFNHMIWGYLFLVIGMSFECEMDKFLLGNLNHVQDDLPIGKSKWLIVNPNEEALNQSAENIQQALPKCTIVKVKEKFDLWVNNNMPQLQDESVFAF